MAEASATAKPISGTPVTQTTRRGLATASFCLAFWGMLTFWWYPFGLMLSSLALTFGLMAVFFGWRSGQNGYHLAWLGVFFAVNGQGLAIASYRLPQLIFEESLPPFLMAIWPF